MEIGGNVDRERFRDEVIEPLMNGKTVCYRPFDCSTQTLKDSVTVAPKKLTIVEGVYSTHPSFERYYDLSIFLDIAPKHQKERILKRNSPQFAKRFFDEWIPLENKYFTHTEIKKRADVLHTIQK
jgi:uridine kinase